MHMFLSSNLLIPDPREHVTLSQDEVLELLRSNDPYLNVLNLGCKDHSPRHIDATIAALHQQRNRKHMGDKIHHHQKPHQHQCHGRTSLQHLNLFLYIMNNDNQLTETQIDRLIPVLPPNVDIILVTEEEEDGDDDDDDDDENHDGSDQNNDNHHTTTHSNAAQALDQFFHRLLFFQRQQKRQQQEIDVLLTTTSTTSTLSLKSLGIIWNTQHDMAEDNEQHEFPFLCDFLRSMTSSSSTTTTTTTSTSSYTLESLEFSSWNVPSTVLHAIADSSIPSLSIYSNLSERQQRLPPRRDDDSWIQEAPTENKNDNAQNDRMIVDYNHANNNNNEYNMILHDGHNTALTSLTVTVSDIHDLLHVLRQDLRVSSLSQLLHLDITLDLITTTATQQQQQQQDDGDNDDDLYYDEDTSSFFSKLHVWCPHLQRLAIRLSDRTTATILQAQAQAQATHVLHQEVEDDRQNDNTGISMGYNVWHGILGLRDTLQELTLDFHLPPHFSRLHDDDGIGTDGKPESISFRPVYEKLIRLELCISPLHLYQLSADLSTCTTHLQHLTLSYTKICHSTSICCCFRCRWDIIQFLKLTLPKLKTLKELVLLLDVDDSDDNDNDDDDDDAENQYDDNHFDHDDNQQRSQEFLLALHDAALNHLPNLVSITWNHDMYIKNDNKNKDKHLRLIHEIYDACIQRYTNILNLPLPLIPHAIETLWKHKYMNVVHFLMTQRHDIILFPQSHHD